MIALRVGHFLTMKPACDASRQLVPQHLQEVFYGRQWLAEWTARLWILQGELRSLEDKPYARDLDVLALSTQLETVRQAVLRGMPWCQCGCRSDSECPICHNTRWVSTGEFLKAQSQGPPSAASDCSSSSPS